MNKSNAIVHIISGFIAWLSGIVGVISGGMLAVGWLFDKTVPTATQDVLVGAVIVFVLALIFVIMNMILMVKDF